MRKATRTLRPATDAGQVTNFARAQHVKPQGFIARLARSVMSWVLRREVDPRRTTQQGSGASSPAAYQQTLIAQRYERRNVINDCRELYLDDPRVSRAINKYVDEATRKGCFIKFESNGPKRLVSRAEEVGNRVVRECGGSLWGWGASLILEGDLFVQAVIGPDGLVGLKRMPASSMERLSDDADEFPDPARAFEQIDVMTNASVAAFPLALMHHARWRHIDGDRYGTPEIIAIRRPIRKVDLMEDAAVVRRMARASITRVWNIYGDLEKKLLGTKEDVEQFKADYGFVEGKRDPYAPLEQIRDVFGNGGVSGEVLDGDQKVAEIDDLRYHQNVAAVCLPTPAPLYNLDAEAVNRDVLEDQRAEWLKDTQKLADAIASVVRWAVETALLVEGIDPDMVPFAVTMSVSSIEKPGESIENVLKMLRERIISKRTGMTLLREFTGVEDVDAELAEIRKETEEEQMYAQAQGVPGPYGNSKPIGLKVSELARK